MRLPQNYKLLAFLPPVFIIGGEGFAMFAPYVVFVLTVAYVTRRLKPPQPHPQPAPLPATT